MSSVKRLRIFAGPNGSGKSTFINAVKEKPPIEGFKLGYYINADDIEQELRNSQSLSFQQYGLDVTTKGIQSYFKKSTFAPVRLEKPELWKSFTIENNALSISKNLKIDSYIAADLAEFIRKQLLKSAHSFSYETVMSDKKKISFLRKAKKEGYKIYLYFFTTNDPLINISRVQVRVAQKGHAVKADVIEKRYYKSLQNLRSAVKLANRSYLFDNSKTASVLVAEITEGKTVNVIDPNNVPNWFWDYVVGK